MPELTGSPKQISWAISIRADFVHQIEHSTDLDKTWKAAFDVIAAHKTEAMWWIEHRGMSANLLCTSTVKDEPELLEEIKASVESTATCRGAGRRTRAAAQLQQKSMNTC